jgi:arginyl-tRNA synthetase
MKRTVLQVLRKHVKVDESILETPPSADMGDVALPCFKLSKKLKDSPQSIAAQLKQKIKSPLIERVEVKGGYLNFFLDKNKYAQKVLKKKYKKTGKGRVMVEYANLNTHKNMHIGHLKNVAMGLSLCRILSHVGYTVVPTYYINDFGYHVAQVLWYLNKYNPKPPKKNKLEWLGSVYVKAHEKVSESVKFGKEAKHALDLMERKDPEITKLWRKTWKWSIDDLEELYKELGAHIMVRLYEHQHYDKGRDIVDEMLRKRVAKKSKGAVILDLKKHGLGVMILIKSDGTTVYATADLSLAKHKFEKYKLDRSVYVVGSEQKHYFKQLFKAMELLGFKQEMVHAQYGLVQLKAGKMSSRWGTVVLYSELTRKMREKTLKETLKRNPRMSESRLKKVSDIIAFGALKYDMLKTDNNKPSVFDWEQALKLEGDTAPYIQYAAVRAKKILKKSKKRSGKIVDISDEGFQLVKKIAEFHDVVNQAASKYAQNLVANYAYDLAKLFNDFYDKHKVIGSSLEQQRLSIVKAFHQTIEKALYLLGISVPEVM